MNCDSMHDFFFLVVVYFGQHIINKPVAFMCKILEERKVQLSKSAFK